MTEDGIDFSFIDCRWKAIDNIIGDRGSALIHLLYLHFYCCQRLVLKKTIHIWAHSQTSFSYTYLSGSC